MFDGALQTISFIVLSYGIVKIRNFIVSHGMANAINSRMICLQCVCCGAYLFANLLLYIEIILFSLSSTDKTT